ncbi:hypothetical protein EYC84_004809 [Monilinia fructicola]|uniref:histone acetyltransferase n=1 Tax=Monilinia fructicola TaxID=38448 RepID=A0A5M9K1L5_MONFR|nr:hypothetical protein EYC84_004809 [Monilinia fructicola]
MKLGLFLSLLFCDDIIFDREIRYLLLQVSTFNQYQQQLSNKHSAATNPLQRKHKRQTSKHLAIARYALEVYQLVQSSTLSRQRNGIDQSNHKSDSITAGYNHLEATSSGFIARRATSPEDMAPPNTQNPQKQNPPKRKATEEPPTTPVTSKRVKMNEEELGEMLDSQNKQCPIKIIPFPEKPAVIEEREGEIEFRVVNNDDTPQSTVILSGLKGIFQKQLPKMPKEYIARLVYDRNHLSIALVKASPLEVIGGITYRPFDERKFAEIVFCAISSDQQVKGYGAHLMCHLKDYVKASSNVMHFLTYADNYAIGYFKKQGFTKEITLEKSLWMGYIKDYEGGTIMQCTMLPRVRYLETGRMLLKQKEAVHAKYSPLANQM